MNQKTLPPIKRRSEFDCLVILRGCMTIAEDVLHTLKTNPSFQDHEFAKANFEFRKLIDKRMRMVLKDEHPETTSLYNKFAENLVKAFNDSAQLEFLEDHEKEITKEGQWFSIQIDGAKAYAQYANERYWLPRNPKGFKESEIIVNGIMVQ